MNMFEFQFRWGGKRSAFGVDDNAQLSEGNDNGCYVAAWVWVGFGGTKYDKEKGEDEERHEATETTETTE